MRWVVKAGSNMVCSGGPLLIRAWMQQVAALRKQKIEVIWVTSGAIASAVTRANYAAEKRTLAEKQALSAIGQPIVMDLYNLALGSVGLLGAQVLLTYGDMADPGRRGNLQNTLLKLLEWGVTPVLNENDAVATDEIKFGDNDSLSAKVASMLKADRLVILTDVDGYYDGDPRKKPDAKLIPQLASVTDAILAGVDQGAGTTSGSGGMYSKLTAARVAAESGIETWLAKGDRPSVLLDIAAGNQVGTRIGKQAGTVSDAGKPV